MNRISRYIQDICAFPLYMSCRSYTWYTMRVTLLQLSYRVKCLTILFVSSPQRYVQTEKQSL